MLELLFSINTTLTLKHARFLISNNSVAIKLFTGAGASLVASRSGDCPPAPLPAPADGGGVDSRTVISALGEGAAASRGARERESPF